MSARRVSKGKLGSGKRFSSFVSKLRREGHSKSSAVAIADRGGRRKRVKRRDKWVAQERTWG